jgi:TonB-linked SusC/RagA family outer membrane protein
MSAFTLAVLLLWQAPLQAKDALPEIKISMSVTDAPLKKTLRKIEHKTSLKFFYLSSQIDADRKVSLEAHNAPLKTLLNDLFKDTGISYNFRGDQILLKQATQSAALNTSIEAVAELPVPTEVASIEESAGRKVNEIVAITVTGKVTDSNGITIPGVSILVKGTNTGTVTDAEGNYSVNVPDADAILVISSIGYTTQEIAVNGRTVINVTLVEDVQSLEEVVVVGYGTKRQSELSSSVSVVEEEDLKKGVISQNLGSMLQGKVPGLTVSNTSGRPGQATNIVIRGVGSIGAGYAPLYVVDGIIGGSANPMDIASITVLKDAAATGLYGSRAANGVIIITTKRGESGKTRVSYNGQAGSSHHRNGNIEMMNSAELYERQRQGFKNFYDVQVAAGAPNFIDRTFDEYLQTVLPASLLETDTDWQSLLTRTGYINQHQLSVSGGNEKTTFYISGNYYYESGTVLSTYYRNMELRANLKHKISDRFTLHARINSGADKRPNEPLTGQEGTMAQYYINVPWDPAFESDGITPYNPSKPGNTWIGNGKSNHFYNVQHQSDITKSMELNTDLQLDAKIADWITFSSTNRVGFDGSDWTQLLDKDHQLANFENGRVSQTYSYDNSFLTSNVLNLFRSVGDHNFAGIIGQEYNYIKNSYTTAVGMDIVEGLSAVSAAASPKSVSGNSVETAFSSYFGQLDYNYAGRYFLVGSVRRDASSRFGANNRWATFYSMGASWNLHKENFLSDVSWINLLKVRASYGTTGNANISPYLSLGTYSFTAASTYNGISGAWPARMENPDLTWEMAYTTNLGVEFALLNRVRIEVDLYNRDNKDLLQNVPLSASSGFSSQQRNVGSVRNRGIDLNLTTTNINGAFRWETNFNLNINRNRVLSLNQHEDIASGKMRIREGLPMRYFYMKEWAGADVQTGDPLWVRWEDGEGNIIHGADKEEPARILTTNVYNQASNLFVGSAYPDFTGGVRSDMYYKNFSLSILGTFAVGQSIYFEGRERTDSDNNSTNQNQMKFHKDWVRWEKPGDVATHPKLLSGGSGSNGTSTRYLEDASYFRIQNVRLDYTFPNRVYKFKGLRVYASVDYVAVFTNFSGADPDVNMENPVIAQGANSARYSPTRKVMFGISFDL